MDEEWNEQSESEFSAEIVEPIDNSMRETPEEKIQFSSGFSAGIAANRDAEVKEAGAFGIAAGRDMNLSNGGAFSIAVGHDLTLTNGGAVVMPVGNTAEITGGGAFFLLGNHVTAQKGFFGIVFAQHVTLEEGSKVLLDTKQALLFGAALGGVLALLTRLFRRK